MLLANLAVGTAYRQRKGRMATDEQLMAEFIAGSESAFRELVSRYERELYVFLQRFVNNGAAAEDLFQEAFIQVYRNADKFDSQRRFRSWLFTIASNKARDYLRSSRRRATQSLDANFGTENEKAAFADVLETDGGSAQDLLIGGEDAAAIREMIGRLPDIYREVLILSYFSHFSYKQTAEVLDVPVGTVKSRLHSALTQFGRLWKQRQAEQRL